MSGGTALVLAGATALAALAVSVVVVLRAHRARGTSAGPFPAAWRTLLQRSLPLYARMPPALRTRLEPLVRSFLAQVRFVGCRGLAVTEDMRLLIATQACVLIVEGDPRAYRSLRSLLLYPDEFVVPEAEEDEAGVVTEGERALSGQTMDTSRIILSWQDVQQSGVEGEAYNVVLHEFAHYLDHALDGALTDPGSGSAALAGWHEVLGREYAALGEAIERGEDTLIDPYGAEHPAEFFAVATETFFEEPGEMRRRHPRLYAELQKFYGLDPAAW